MRRLVVPAGLLALALLVGAAMVWDCVRLEEDARERVGLADAEMRRHEERLVRILEESGDVPPAVDAAIAAYRGAADAPERHEAWGKLVASCRGTIVPRLDPTHPLDRKLMDDIAGAINRREVAEEAYAVELAEYRELAKGLRGRVAARFSPGGDGQPLPGE